MIRTHTLTACAILMAAIAQAGSYEGTCPSTQAEAATYCTVGVSEFESGEPADLYADENLSEPLSNPLLAEHDGTFRFFAGGGVYQLRLTGASPNADSHSVAFAWIPSQNA